MDNLIFTVIGTGVGVVGFIYMFLRNFKEDINKHMYEIRKYQGKMDRRVMETNKRMDGVYNVLLKRLESKD